MTDRPAPNILVVCTGNLCRSPLGAALLRRRLERDGVAAEVTSVGLGAPLGRSPDRKLQRVANDLGVDVSDHQSRPVSEEHLRWAGLILTMTGEQTAQLHRLDATTEGRTATLRSAAWRAGLLPSRQLPFADWVALLAADVPLAERAKNDTAYDIADPIGGPLRLYRAMGDEVDRLMRALVSRWSGR